jgi:hypothetical protein
VSLFEPVREDGSWVKVVGVLSSILKNKWIQRIALLGMIFLIAGLGGWSWFWSATRDATCREPTVKELGVDDFLALRERKAQYQRSIEPTAWLTMKPEELTYLLAETKGLFVELAAEGKEFEGYIGMPAPGGCYNVHFKGQVDVEDTVLTLIPSTMVFGGYDLSALLGGRSFEFSPDDLADPDVGRLLSNVRAFRVRDGTFQFRLKDKSMKWSFGGG